MLEEEPIGERRAAAGDSGRQVGPSERITPKASSSSAAVETAGRRRKPTSPRIAPTMTSPPGKRVSSPPFFSVSQSQKRLPACTRKYDCGVA